MQSEIESIEKELEKINCDAIIADFYKDYVKYANMYGEKTVLLYQIDSFYESYAFGSNISNKPIIVGPGKFVSTILQMPFGIADHVFTKSNDHYTIGFPLKQLEKNVKKMTDDGFTVIVYNSIDEKREIINDGYQIYLPDKIKMK